MMKETVQDRFIDLFGGTIFVRSWGPGHGVPVVMLHDSLGCVELWRDFPAALAERLERPVFAYDRLGFGKSSRREQTLSRNFVREEAEVYFPALRQALEISEYILFGHSVGGAMALSIAAADPRQCVAVITESAQAFVEDRTLEGIRDAADRFQDREQIAKLEKWHGDRAAWVLHAWTDIWQSSEFADWSLEPILPDVRCPVLAIHGDMDEFGSMAFPRMIGGGVSGPSEVLMMESVGHVPHRERPDEVLDAVERFLASPKIR